MRLSLSSLLLAAAGVAQAASSWSFDDASITISSKGSASKVTETFNAQSPLSTPLALGPNDVAKITLTTTDGGQGKRPHQAFLLLQDAATGLEAPFPLTVKESGKGAVSVAYKDLPAQFLAAAGPLHANIVIGAFGASAPFLADAPVFALAVHNDPAQPAPTAPERVRYGKKPEISHIFREDARSPPTFISLVFVLAVAAAVPVLLGAWALLGANAGHLGTALSAAPVSHAAFFGSIVAMEGVFFLYYTSWTLFQTVPVALGVGLVTVLSGTKALGEVQARRLAGER